MLDIKKIHHIAIITSDYNKSKLFYTNILGFKILQETYRADKRSYKLDLAINGIYKVELFSFENPPKRLTNPEATGLRHLAFAVENIDVAVAFLKEKDVKVESIRTDKLTNRRFTFFRDPDNLPLELYEI